MDSGTGHPPAGLDPQKKTLGATERDEAQRRQFRERVAAEPQNRFVVVDECGTNINLTRRYGRAPRGVRAQGAVPRNTARNRTLIASLSMAGIGPAMLLDGATDTVAFEVYVERLLAPSLAPGTIVVLDNLAAHRSERVREVIEAQGCQLWYLPAYSPDLSPIEEAFAKLKALLRQAEARTREALDRAIAEALPEISSTDAQGFFSHCGYGRQAQ